MQLFTIYHLILPQYSLWGIGPWLNAVGSDSNSCDFEFKGYSHQGFDSNNYRLLNRVPISSRIFVKFEDENKYVPNAETTVQVWPIIDGLQISTSCNRAV